MVMSRMHDITFAAKELPANYHFYMRYQMDEKTGLLKEQIFIAAMFLTGLVVAALLGGGIDHTPAGGVAGMTIAVSLLVLREKKRRAKTSEAEVAR